jgi:hypothetical protein
MVLTLFSPISKTTAQEAEKTNGGNLLKSLVTFYHNIPD